VERIEGKCDAHVGGDGDQSWSANRFASIHEAESNRIAICHEADSNRDDEAIYTMPNDGHHDHATHLENNGHSFYGGGSSYHEGNNSGEGFQTRTIRLDFHQFDGEDLETWWCHAAQFFDFYGTLDVQRLSISSFQMESKALVWFQELKASKCVANWEEFGRAMQIRFGKGSYDDPMETLSKLRQVGLLQKPI
jgi:hypothetical protein